MTYREAIKEIAKRVTEIGRFNPVYAEALDMAVEALEKQMPMLPTGFRDEWKDTCPKCGAIVTEDSSEMISGGLRLAWGFKYKYCPLCGQAIDWSSGDEDD